MILIDITDGVTDVADDYEDEFDIIILVTVLPTSFRLQLDRYWETVTLRGGYSTLYFGSLSKHRYMVGVVSCWMIGYTLVSLKLRVNGGGTTCNPCMTVKL